MTPPFTSYHKRCCYTAHTDLQKLLHIGKNVIGMVIAPGWRRNEGEYLKATGGREIPFMGRPRFTAVLELFGENGKHARICADEKWESTRGAIVQTNIFRARHMMREMKYLTGVHRRWHMVRDADSQNHQQKRMQWNFRNWSRFKSGKDTGRRQLQCPNKAGIFLILGKILPEYVNFAFRLIFRRAAGLHPAWGAFGRKRDALHSSAQECCGDRLLYFRGRE